MEYETVKPVVDSVQNHALLTSLFSGAIVLIGWLASKLFDSSKKEIKEMQSEIRTTQKDIHSILLAIEHLKGQMALALSLPKELDEVKKQVWAVESKASAAWRVLDKKRHSDS